MANTQKTAIVTGASQGIGAGLVEAFLKRDYRIVANSRNITRANPFMASANLALVDGDVVRRIEKWRTKLQRVNAFWWVSMYNPHYNLVDKPINPYSLGDLSGMKVNVDGSLDIYVQKDSPPVDQEANCLPAPTGNSFLNLRTYWPGKETRGADLATSAFEAGWHKVVGQSST